MKNKTKTDTLKEEKTVQESPKKGTEQDINIGDLDLKTLKALAFDIQNQLNYLKEKYMVVVNEIKNRN